MIKVTPRALTQLLQIARKEKVCRILFSVQGGGCNGFKYNLSPVNNVQSTDEIIPLDTKLDLVVDTHSIFHLLGTTIDWKQDTMGSRFDFSNPNASSNCGCGATFSL